MNTSVISKVTTLIYPADRYHCELMRFDISCGQIHGISNGCKSDIFHINGKMSFPIADFVSVFRESRYIYSSQNVFFYLQLQSIMFLILSIFPETTAHDRLAFHAPGESKMSVIKY